MCDLCFIFIHTLGKAVFRVSHGTPSKSTNSAQDVTSLPEIAIPASTLSEAIHGSATVATHETLRVLARRSRIAHDRVHCSVCKDLEVPELVRNYRLLARTFRIPPPNNGPRSLLPFLVLRLLSGMQYVGFES